jgi:two-component sensor histidine kinase
LERAEAAERAKDLLLQELGHRTKNNLMMAISVLSLQARSKSNPETKAALEKAIARIHAIAGAHEHFSPSIQSGRVEMRQYLEALCGYLGESLREVRPIAVRVMADEVYLRTEKAVPIGLIVNELVTNSLKHAFPGERDGTVLVTLKNDPPSLHLVVQDNGVGCPQSKEERIGSRLTRLFAQQLDATINWEDASPGCRVHFILPAS